MFACFVPDVYVGMGVGLDDILRPFLPLLFYDSVIVIRNVICSLLYSSISAEELTTKN